MAQLAIALAFAGGLVVAAHAQRWRQQTAVETGALAVAFGVAIIIALTVLRLVPRPGQIGLLALVVVLAPLYLYRFYRRELNDAASAAGQPKSADKAATSAELMTPVDDAASPAPSSAASADDAASPASAPARPSPTGEAPRFDGWWRVTAIALLLVAGYFRLWGLDYSEFQGDEARAMTLAEQLVHTNSADVLLSHKKGPVEVLLPAIAVRWGDASELMARFPSALAGLAAVFALLALGSRLWGRRVGFIAAFLLALDGYLIAFSRVVQYQSVVVLFSILAVWAAYRFYRRDEDGDRLLALSGFLLGLGTWAHYEMIFAALPVAWLVLARWREEKWSWREGIRRVLPAKLIGAFIIVAFYLPFMLHPQFAETAKYIAERRLGGSLYNMLGDYFLRASVYNASYYVIFMAAVVGLAVAWQLRRALARDLGESMDLSEPATGESVDRGWTWPRSKLFAAAWLLAVAVLLARPELFQLGASGPSLAIFIFLPVLVYLLASRQLDVRWKAVLVWFAGPFFVASFLAVKPHTHFYTMVPAYALLAGWALDRVWTWAEAQSDRKQAAQNAVSTLALLLVVFGWHQQVMFMQTVPVEFKRWSLATPLQMAGYWTPFKRLPCSPGAPGGDTKGVCVDMPRGGYFGFPSREGWRVLRTLYQQGEFDGTWDSNEDDLVAGWYTGAQRDQDNPRYYFIVWYPNDPQDSVENPVEAKGYAFRGYIMVSGWVKISVYDREGRKGEQFQLHDPSTVQEIADHLATAESRVDMGNPGARNETPTPGVR